MNTTINSIVICLKVKRNMSSTVDNEKCDKCGNDAINVITVGDNTYRDCGLYNCMPNHTDVMLINPNMITKLWGDAFDFQETYIERDKQGKLIRFVYKGDKYVKEEEEKPMIPPCPVCKTPMLMGYGGRMLGCSNIGCDYND